MNNFRISVFYLLLSVVMVAVVFNSCGDESEESDGFLSDGPSVTINGVTWATRNLATPGTFAENPESYGMYYQWNRKATNWVNTVSHGDVWAKSNDPSPKGWRVPTKEEFEKLLDTKKVSRKEAVVKDVRGIMFTDKKNGNSIFLPCAGERSLTTNGEIVSTGSQVAYWSSTGSYWYVYDMDYGTAYGFDGNTAKNFLRESHRKRGFSIRCVAE